MNENGKNSRAQFILEFIECILGVFTIVVPKKKKFFLQVSNGEWEDEEKK